MATACPFVPDWRATLGATYRPNENCAYTVAARYSGKQYSTLDNTDIISPCLWRFDNYVVVDVKVHYSATKNLAFDFGVDNLLNEQYFLFPSIPGQDLCARRQIHVLKHPITKGKIP